MGKSPGKWIKTILFGKKHSKSNSKASAHYKTPASKPPADELSGNSPVISDPCRLTDRGVEPLELDPVVNQTVIDPESNNSSDANTKRQEQAATVVQAAFRGYLARRAFRALKGIIRLQALIRGHLVRRQAVATLRCMQAIVRLQAKARGQKVNVGLYSSSRSQKLSKNIFARKLLAKMPTAMPLSLQYDSVEPNSAWHWLERWSTLHFWEQPTQFRKAAKVKAQRKPEVVEHVTGKSRRTFRKASSLANGENTASAASEVEKPKSNPRKGASNLTEPVQDPAQNELERVKRSLRKITASSGEASEKTETEAPPPPPVLPVTQSVELATNSDGPVEEVAIRSENPADVDVVEKLDSLESPVDELVDVVLNNHPVIHTHPLENGSKIKSSPTLDDELVAPKEEKIGKENNNKVRKKRSIPTKQESGENVLQNSPSVPSYMAATESAKAKLRASGSPKIVEDVGEQGSTRRHSLPASTNGKLSLSSPRVPKNSTHANGKGSNKSHKPSISSRDDKAGHPGWRR